MPTLFTALQAHAQRAKRKPETVAPRLEGVPTGAAPGYVAELVTMKTKAPRAKRKLKEPTEKVSLLDRFRVRAFKDKRRQVIVVGGGFAGLSAAFELESLGYHVTVLEGQATVGGRVQSRRDIVRGNVMEGGAELIGVNHPAWWSYKRKFQLHLRELSDFDSPPVFLDGKRLNADEAAALAEEMDRVQVRINRIARSVNADEPWKSKGARNLDRRSLVQGLNGIPMSRLCRLAFLEQLQADNGVAAAKQSWLGNLAMIKGGGLSRFWTETETHHCVGGNQQLAFEFRKRLRRVVVNARVKSVRLVGKRATVRVTGRKPFTADDVILAIPPTMWKTITFDPPLPAAYSVQFGKNIKFLLNVRKGSWRPEAPNMSSDGPVDLTWDGTDGQIGKRAGMVAFSGAADAVTCRRWSKRRYLKELRPIYPGFAKKTGKGKLMDWPGNRWAHGSYSFPKPREVMRVGPLLRSGFAEHLHFAGEHTCYAFTGYMEAALQSGIRVAKQLGQRDGILSRKSASGKR